MGKIYHKMVWLVFFFLLAGFIYAENADVTFRIKVPVNTPASDTIYIAGNDIAAGNWAAGKVPLVKKGDNEWEITLSLPKGFDFEYKITRGKWDNEAYYENGPFPQNRKLNVSGKEVVSLEIVDWMDKTVLPGILTGIIKYHRDFPSKWVPRRDIIVILPANYEKESTKRYPVLYMHDGQNKADPRTSFSKVDWGVDEMAEKLAKEGKIPEIIIVGIYNTGQDRLVEYSMTTQGENYMNFIIRELKPVIDSTYRTLPDRENTAVMGSSLGGLISFLMVWEHDDIFSKAGCLSSAFQVVKDRIFDLVNDYKGPKKKIKIYLDHGDKNGEKTLVEPTQKMRDMLIKKGFVQGKDLDYFWDKGAEHNEAAWKARLDKPLVFLFGR